jgi:hypothetical protein
MQEALRTFEEIGDIQAPTNSDYPTEEVQILKRIEGKTLDSR